VGGWVGAFVQGLVIFGVRHDAAQQDKHATSGCVFVRVFVRV